MLKFLRIFIALGFWAAVSGAQAVPSIDPAIAHIGEAWADLKYQPGNVQARLLKVRALEAEAMNLSGQFPADARLLYWRAQFMCLEAELIHSIASLERMRTARELLEKAEQLDPGSSAIQALLGSVYYEVPGWPLSFGSDKKAETYLREALALEPDGMDANYFMGDFLLEQGRPADAMSYLETAARSSGRLPPSHVVAGRREEIFQALDKARKRLSK